MIGKEFERGFASMKSVAEKQAVGTYHPSSLRNNPTTWRSYELR